MANQVKSSLFWTSIEKISILGIQFLGTVILSRKLSPEDFGLIGLLTIFIAFSNMLVDSGMGGALVREKIITKIDLSTLFIYNGSISILLYIILYLIAPLLSSFYEYEIICPLLRVLGLSVIFSSLSITQVVQLSRNLDFRSMAICGLSSSLLSTIISIYSAYKGVGVWAIVIQVVLQAALYSSFLFCACRFIPIFQFSKTSFKKQFKYGIGLLGANSINTFAANINNSIIGKIFNLKLTGFYTQSTRLYNIPNGFLTSVTEKALFPILSKENSNSNIIEFTLKSIHLSGIFIFPLWALLSVSAPFVVSCILGSQWIDSAWIFSILCLGGMFSMIKSLYRNLFKVAGYTMLIMKLETISVFVTISLLFIASFISFRTVVVSVLISNVLSSILFMIYTRIYFNIDVRRQIDMLKSPAICSIIVYVIAFLFRPLVEDFHPLISLFLIIMISIIVICSYYIVTNNHYFLKLIKLQK